MKAHRPSRPVAPPPAPAQLLDALPTAAALVDGAGTVRGWNRALAALTGIAPARALGTPFKRFLADEAFCATCRRALAGRFPPGRQAAGLRTGTGAVLATETEVRPLGTGEAAALLLLVHPVPEPAALPAAGSARPAGFQDFVGRNRQMLEVYRLIELAAATDVTVLFLGESGTGKELGARAVHALSARRAGPLVQVNCAALTETILESELFGHVKGAFTGAYQDRAGRFEAADGGTLFLDEIGEITPAVQVKLLRVLQHREFERVGEDRTRHVDVRVIAATNRDLAGAVRRGEFREDLYYRLRVFPIRLPPLRERLDDLPALVAAFIARFNRQTGKRIADLDEQALRAVMDYCWPGNVRELENAIEYGFVTCQGERIGLFDLPQDLRRFELRREACQERADPAARPERPPGTAPFAQGPARRRGTPPPRAQLEPLLHECGWNKAEVARRLGVSRTLVWKWLRQLGLPLQPD